MSRKLLILNLALGLLVVAGLWRLWAEIEASDLRESATLNQPLEPADIPPESPAEIPAPLVAADYIDVADQVLFFRDRNPNVVIVAEAPKPLPPMPVAHGVLDLGSGPTIILSANAKAPQQAYRVGDFYEDFEILDISPTEVIFGWEGQQLRRSIEELTPAVESASAPPQTVAKKNVAKTKSGVLGNETDAGPGDVDMGGDVRACRPGDTSPPGTVVGNYKKVVSRTPFGQVCRWVPAQ